MQLEILSIRSLQECLSPKYFDSIIKCTKQVEEEEYLFTLQLQKCLKLLINLRKIVSFIDNKNTFLFPLSYSLNCLRASDVIRKFSKLCDATNPENITSTRL